MKNEIVLFTDGDVNIEVQINPEQETVWLTQKQMEVLFDVKHATVSEHISNILASGELDETSVGFSDRSTGGRKPKIYNLDMILSVGYRVNSKRGIAFRKWANNVLKQFILKGYAINEKRLQALKKTVDIQSRMLADALEIEENRSESPFCCLPIITIGVVDYRHCNQKNLKIYLSTSHKSV